MLGGLVSLVISPPVDLVALVVIGIGRAASVGFLRLATLFLAQAFDLATFSAMCSR